MTKRLLMGNEAIAHAALEAGVGVVAGYPGTPSSEIVETVARQVSRGAAHGVYVEWSVNEKAALEMLFGASLAGARGLFTCKQMGLNVASDALMSLNYVGVRGGLVLIVADDPGPISSQTEQDTRRFASFAKVPVLDPSTPEQAFDMVKAAFDLSERFGTPVIVRPTTRVDHASAFFDVQEETQALPVLDGGFDYDPARWIIFPQRSYEAHGEINDRLPEIANVFSSELPYSAFNVMDEAGESFTGEPTFGILTGGITAAYVREALRMINERARQAGIGVPAYRFMQIGTPYPFPERAISAFVTGLADVLVLEELDCVLEDQLAMFSGRTHGAFNIHGKRTGEARDRGENDVDDILARIERFLGLTGRLSLYRFRGTSEFDAQSIRLSARKEAELPNRPPVLCAGCPHRGAFYAVKQALGDDEAVMCGDIGCYTLGNAHPLDAIDTCLCMGGGITMAQGIAVADPTKKAIAYVGDSTFFASGMPGIASAAYNGHDITVMVLDNSTTAMTGDQPHPGTGQTLMGHDRKPISIEAVLRANNFDLVERTNAFDRDTSVAAVRKALDHPGPSAVIFEGPCIQIVKPKPPVIINQEICTGCKRCITGIGCPAISFNNAIAGPRSRGRGQATIDTSLCTGCGLCTQVCPFHAIHFDSSVYRGIPPFVAGRQTVEEALADQERAAEREPGLLADVVVNARAASKAKSGAHAPRHYTDPDLRTLKAEPIPARGQKRGTEELQDSASTDEGMEYIEEVDAELIETPDSVDDSRVEEAETEAVAEETPRNRPITGRYATHRPAATPVEEAPPVVMDRAERMEQAGFAAEVAEVHEEAIEPEPDDDLVSLDALSQDSVSEEQARAQAYASGAPASEEAHVIAQVEVDDAEELRQEGRRAAAHAANPAELLDAEEDIDLADAMDEAQAWADIDDDSEPPNLFSYSAFDEEDGDD